ncbi:uncharacterized protein LOC135368731 [Ornithodoros turicata]|uniref:uncharacterized protein LOC135368731 n=1 Tax=Ornithodoros turicata TaxID=34597 RepID=UPI0031398CCD
MHSALGFVLVVAALAALLAPVSSYDEWLHVINQPKNVSAVEQQRQLATQLLQLFSISGGVAEKDGTGAPPSQAPNGSFKPSNPYWLLVNGTRQEIVKNDNSSSIRTRKRLEQTVSKEVYTAQPSSNAIPSPVYHSPTSAVAFDVPTHSESPETSTEQTYVYVSSPQTVVKVKSNDTSNNVGPSTLHTERFTIEDVPRWDSSWYPLKREEVLRKMEEARVKHESRKRANSKVPNIRVIQPVPVSPVLFEDEATHFSSRPRIQEVQESRNSYRGQHRPFNDVPVPFSEPIPHRKFSMPEVMQEPYPDPEPFRPRRYKKIFSLNGAPVYTASSSVVVPVRVRPTNQLLGQHQKHASGQELLKDDSRRLQKEYGRNLTSFGAPRKPLVTFTRVTPPLQQAKPVVRFVRHREHSALNFPPAIPSSDEVHLPMFAITPRSGGDESVDDTSSASEEEQHSWIPGDVTKPTAIRYARSVKSVARRDTIAVNSSNPLDDSETIKPSAMWRGLAEPNFYQKPNQTSTIESPRSSQRRIDFAAASVSPFDATPIGNEFRVSTVYGRKTHQKPALPSTLDKADGLSGRRHDDDLFRDSRTPWSGKPFGEEKGDDYLLPKREKDNYRPDSSTRFPPNGPKQHGTIDKFDPEFDRPRYLTPPPLFPDNYKSKPKNEYGPERPFFNRYHEEKPNHLLPHGPPDKRPNSINDKLEEIPERFDDLGAWKYMSRPGFPPYRYPGPYGGSLGGPFGGSFGGPGAEVGIGTIIPVKKHKFNGLFGKGGITGGGIFGGLHHQGWYCPCSFYPPAGRFVTAGFPGFWSGPPGIGR